MSTINYIRLITITLVHKGDRPASVSCCGGWAKWSKRSNLLSLNVEVILDTRMTDRLLRHLSPGERHFNLEIQSRADVGPTRVKLFPNCRTESIEFEFGPPRPVGCDTIWYYLGIKTEQGASRTNGELLGSGGDTKRRQDMEPATHGFGLQHEAGLRCIGEAVRKPHLTI